MKREGWLERDTYHCISRAKERGGLNKKRAKRIIDNAKTRGITSDKCRWSKDRMYLEERTKDNCIAVAYNGYCFILDKDTKNCITMYSLPRYFGKKKTYYKRYTRFEEAYA